MSDKPVFFDSKNRRWKRFKLVTQLLGVILTLIFCGLVASVASTPSLPSPALLPIQKLLQQSHASSAFTPTPTLAPTAVSTNVQNLRTRQSLVRQVSHAKDTDLPVKIKIPRRNVSFHLPPPTPGGSVAFNAPLPISTPAAPTPIPAPSPVLPASPNHTQVIGFFVNWDDNSFTSLKQNINNIDKLIPEWLHLTDASGTIAPDDAAAQQQVVDYIKQNRPNLPIIPLINNYDNNTQSWNSDAVGGMLADPADRSRTVQSLLAYVQSNHFAGVSIDFENIPPADQAQLTAFMRELYGVFHPLGLQVSQSVPVDDNSYDYRSLARFNDYLILMTYDEHWDGSDPGPVASQQFFANALQQRFSEVSPSKYVVGIGGYGYDWTVGAAQGTEVSFQQAVQLAQTYGAQIRLDPVSLNPTFDYTDASGALHHVWYLDAISAFNQIAETHRYPIQGLALWRMGSEDPAVWQVLKQRANLNAPTAHSLSQLQYGYDISYQGKGEILKVSSVPANGQRAVAYDNQTGLITGEQFLSFPSPYVITRWGGGDPNKIAITFDDGPDPQWTPQILSILKQYNVPGTFFVIGSNANANPGILQQIVSDGNEIGNHTYTHPNISVISETQFAVELNATQRLIGSELGLRTILFRPPYSEDVEPNSPDQVKPLLLSGRMGYYTIGMQIDPSDYMRPGVDNIVQSVISQATSGAGNVVLLHDGGGDRSQTVAALPLIIQQLRAHGYQLVSVSDLMGLSRAQVMPPLTANQRAIAIVDNLGFQMISKTNSLLSVLFLTGIFLGLLRFAAIGFLAIVGKRRTRQAGYPSAYRPSVSIVVPAYNEARVIEKTINSLLATTYPGMEIILVDDGSIDGTYERVVELFGNNSTVHAFRKQNGGKAEALNYGIARSKSEIIVALDSDTIVRPDAVTNLVRHFADERVGAVAGNAKVGNRINLLTNWQALEYITSQNLDRRAFAWVNSITVVPGAIGAWRRGLLLEMGGFTNDTLAEDTDMTLRILRSGHTVEYADDAVAFTEAPDTVRGFLKQRFRWMYGTMQAAWKNRDTAFRARYKALGLLAMPNILIFQIFFPVISPLMDLAAIAAIVEIFIQISEHPLDPLPTGLQSMVFFYILFLLLDFLTALIAFSLEKKEDWSLIIWLVLQRFFYRQLLYYAAVQAVVTAIRGPVVGWNKLARKATVSLPRQ